MDRKNRLWPTWVYCVLGPLFVGGFVVWSLGYERYGQIMISIPLLCTFYREWAGLNDN